MLITILYADTIYWSADAFITESLRRKYASHWPASIAEDISFHHFRRHRYFPSDDRQYQQIQRITADSHHFCIRNNDFHNGHTPMNNVTTDLGR